MRAGGRFNIRRADSILRFMLCLVTESRAIFLGTTTAYPSPSFGITAAKWVDEILRLVAIAAGNKDRGNRFLRGNTANIRRKGVFDRCGGVSV